MRDGHIVKGIAHRSTLAEAVLSDLKHRTTARGRIRGVHYYSGPSRAYAACRGMLVSLSQYSYRLLNTLMHITKNVHHGYRICGS